MGAGSCARTRARRSRPRPEAEASRRPDGERPARLAVSPVAAVAAIAAAAALAIVAAFGDVRQERHLAGALDRDRDLALVAAARAADPARADLALLGDVAAKLADVLVVDLVDLALAEEARLPPAARQRREALPASLLVVLYLPRLSVLLERDVVVGGSAEICVGALRCAGGHELVRLAAAARAVAAAEELHGVGDHLDRLALGAVLGLPLAPLEAPVDSDRAALREVLRAVLTLVAPDGDVEVVRLLGPLAGRAVLAARVDREPQAATPAVPLGVCRSSGSRVRLPTSTTRLMFAMVSAPSCVESPGYSAAPPASSAGADTAPTGAGAFV